MEGRMDGRDSSKLAKSLITDHRRFGRWTNQIQCTSCFSKRVVWNVRCLDWSQDCSSRTSSLRCTKYLSPSFLRPFHPPLFIQLQTRVIITVARDKLECLNCALYNSNIIQKNFWNGGWNPHDISSICFLRTGPVQSSTTQFLCFDLLSFILFVCVYTIHRRDICPAPSFPRQL